MSRTAQILKGIGSVVNIAPATDYSRFAPKKSPNERIRQSWEKTGQHIRSAMNRFDDGQKED